MLILLHELCAEPTNEIVVNSEDILIGKAVADGTEFRWSRPGAQTTVLHVTETPGDIARLAAGRPALLADEDTQEQINSQQQTIHDQQVALVALRQEFQSQIATGHREAGALRDQIALLQARLAVGVRLPGEPEPEEGTFPPPARPVLWEDQEGGVATAICCGWALKVVPVPSGWIGTATSPQMDGRSEERTTSEAARYAIAWWALTHPHASRLAGDLAGQDRPGEPDHE